MICSRRVDASKAAIVDYFKNHGGSWTHLDAVGKGVPDGILGFLGIDQQVELKSGPKARTKPETAARQLSYRQRWRGRPVVIIHDVREAGMLLQQLREESRARATVTWRDPTRSQSTG